MSAASLRELLDRLNIADPRYATDVVERVLAEAQAPAPATFTFSPAATGSSCGGGSTACLHPVALLPAKVAPNIVARLKVLVRALDLSHRRSAGRANPRTYPGEVEMRVSTFPTLVRREGRRADVRRPGPVLSDLVDLGLPECSPRRARAPARRDLGRDRAVRPRRQRQDHDDLCLPARAGGPVARRAQPGDAGRSDRGRRAGRGPGPGQPGGRLDARVAG